MPRKLFSCAFGCFKDKLCILINAGMSERNIYVCTPEMKEKVKH